MPNRCSSGRKIGAFKEESNLKWLESLDTTAVGKSFSFLFSFHFPAVSSSAVSSSVRCFILPFHFCPHGQLTPFWLLLLVAVLRYQLCIPASCHIYDLEFFRVANQKKAFAQCFLSPREHLSIFSNRYQSFYSIQSMVTTFSC